MNNSSVPINVWVGPSGSITTFVINGGASSIQKATDSNKKVKFFMATSSDSIFNSMGRMDFGIYAYNGANSGRGIINNSPSLYGSIIANKFTMNSIGNVFYQPNFFGLVTVNQYGYDNSWIEMNPL